MALANGDLGGRLNPTAGGDHGASAANYVSESAIKDNPFVPQMFSAVDRTRSAIPNLK